MLEHVTLVARIVERTLGIGVAEVECVRASQVCAAVIALSDDLVATWWVSPSAQEASEDVAKRQGEAIAVFVRDALGERENPASFEPR